MDKRRELNERLNLKKRIEVLREKAKAENLTLPDNVVLYIANQIEGNRKEVEGAFVQLVSYSVLKNRDVDLDLAKQAFPERKGKKIVNIINLPRLFSVYMSRGAAVAAVGSILMVSGCSSIQKNVVAATAPVTAAKDQSSQSDISLNGNAEPFQLITIPNLNSASGTIQNLLVKLGDYVQQGQKIAEIDSKDLTYKIKQAESAVKKSQVDAQMQSLQQQISLMQAKASLSTGGNPVGDLEGAKAKVQDLETALTDAEKNLESVKNQDNLPQNQELAQATALLDRLGKQLNSAKQDEQILTDKATQLSQQSVDPSTAAALNAAKAKVNQLSFAMDDAQKNLDTIKNRIAQNAAREQALAQATASRDQVEKQLNDAKQMVEVLSAKGEKEKLTAEETAQLQQQLNQASASLATMSVEQRQTDLDLLQNQAQNLDVVAPINGFITESPVSSNGGSGSSSGNGSSGSSNSNNAALFTIVNLDQVYVKVDAPESMIGKLKIGQKATVNFPAIGKTFEGKVTYIGEMANLTTMTYPVRILIDNKDYIIRGGMRAIATLND